MLFEHVEAEIKSKEMFILQQSEKIKSMKEGEQELEEYEDVLKKANLIIHGAP